MGTSVSQGSPTSGTASLNWLAVKATYRDERASVDRIVQEVWKAAQRDTDASWSSLLQSPAILACRDIVTASTTVQEALKAASRNIALSGQSSIATAVAKRAIVSSFAASDRSQGFPTALFSEATKYLVSRDLPSLLGMSERTATVASAASLRRAIVENVETTVRSYIATQQSPSQGDISGWGGFVARTVADLSGTGQGPAA